MPCNSSGIHSCNLSARSGPGVRQLPTSFPSRIRLLLPMGQCFRGFRSFFQDVNRAFQPRQKLLCLRARHARSPTHAWPRLLLWTFSSGKIERYPRHVPLPRGCRASSGPASSADLYAASSLPMVMIPSARMVSGRRLRGSGHAPSQALPAPCPYAGSSPMTRSPYTSPTRDS